MRPARPIISRSARPAYTLIEMLLVLGIIAAIAGISWPLLMRPLAQSVAQGAALEFADQLVAARIRAIEESRVYELRWKPGTGEFELKAQHEHRHQPVASVGSNQFDGQQPVRIGTADASNPSTSVTPSDTQRMTVEPTHIHERLPSAVRFESDELIRQLRELSGLDETGRPQPNRPSDSSLPDDPSITDDASIAGDQPADLRGGAALRQIDELNRTRAEERDANGRPRFEIGWSHPIRFFPDGTSSNAKWALLSEDLNRIEIELRGMTGAVRVGKVRPLKLEADDASLSPTSNTQRGTGRQQESAPIRF